MNNLIIGNTSQLNYYFPEDFKRISSRNIDIEFVKNGKFDRVFILFAEQRTFLNESESFFTEVNFDYTVKLINEIKDYVQSIVIYSTSELWNKYEGGVSIYDEFSYNYTPYIKSKEILSNFINENKEKYSNVKIIYPFNFNSPHRKKGFLFSKIFNSISNKEKCFVGDLNFNRDLIHPQKIVNHSITTNEDLLIGGGELINIENFVMEIYSLNNLNYFDYVVINNENSLKNFRNEYYSKIKYSSKEELLNLTYYDIQKYSFS
jgi:nucleoside-diphosphate-sugar epimerase